MLGAFRPQLVAAGLLTGAQAEALNEVDHSIA
jgi:hypothetical protein